ncbi:cell division protein ZapD [Legionella gresilensis]|uniref:cell division protein ZapD n=1 Tax=Legionella gresilensis TaxID=91823 RepID=UPI00104124F0|nr:cell division protein ZapD [Legionella gresilensis]
MSSDIIIFQLATHYLPKIALRLETLYQTINQACEETHPVIHHYALKNIIEIIQLIEKPELKSRFLKELMRIEHLLNKSNLAPSHDLNKRLHAQIYTLNHVAGRFGEKIHIDPFLHSIRIAQPHVDAEVFSPQLLLWLESNSALRQRDLLLWQSYLHTLYSVVNLYLQLLRDTAQFKQIQTNNGFYQCPLPAKTSCHLILLRMNKSIGIVPQMQLGYHGLSVRLCEAATMREVKDTNAQLDLAICQL